jgi:histidinol-phosphate aminotransferase
MNLSNLVRPNILRLKPYSSARDEFKGKEGIFLDANENPFGKLNRYPDPGQNDLKQKLASIRNVSPENIFIGNGSDEAIDILFRVFCEPGRDKVVICPPTYGMYEVCAGINDTGVIRIPLTNDFQLDIESLSRLDIRAESIKMIFLCSPNNPTGNTLLNIHNVLEIFKGIVVVDEAYIDFSDAESYINKIADHPRLVVLQTMSKARGLAAARIGIAYASPKIVAFLNKVKPPYNISTLNQEAALKALDNQAVFEKQKQEILAQKRYLQDELIKLACVNKIFTSDANFLLVDVTDADMIYNELVKSRIITRNRNSVIRNCVRITVGTKSENQKLLQQLKQLTIFD